MTEAYSVYWAQPRWQRAASVDQCLTVLFGGPHRSEPSFRRASVQLGDLLYPIGVCDQVLYVFGRMCVQDIVVVGNDQGLLDDYAILAGPPGRPIPLSRPRALQVVPAGMDPLL